MISTETPKVIGDVTLYFNQVLLLKYQLELAKDCLDEYTYEDYGYDAFCVLDIDWAKEDFDFGDFLSKKHFAKLKKCKRCKLLFGAIRKNKKFCSDNCRKIVES